MEAMACGLPCLVSRIRGNTDLIEERNGGKFIEPFSKAGCSIAIMELKENITILKNMSSWNRKKSAVYNDDNIKEIMREIYKIDGTVIL